MERKHMSKGRRSAVVPPSSIVMIFHGSGWGKTSAAIGYAMRSVGRQWKTTFIQFVKGAAWNAAETHMAQQAGVNWPTFTHHLTWAQDPQQLCDQAWAVATTALTDPMGGLVVLDEVSHAVSNGWLDIDELVRAISTRCTKTSVILTGRYMLPELYALAETVTYFSREQHTERTGILLPDN